jgi:hypothetical protein
MQPLARSSDSARAGTSVSSSRKTVSRTVSSVIQRFRAVHRPSCEPRVGRPSQDKSATEQFRTRPSMMRRPNSQQPVIADSSVA